MSSTDPVFRKDQIHSITIRVHTRTIFGGIEEKMRDKLFWKVKETKFLDKAIQTGVALPALWLNPALSLMTSTEIERLCYVDSTQDVALC